MYLQVGIMFFGYFLCSYQLTDLEWFKNCPPILWKLYPPCTLHHNVNMNRSVSAFVRYVKALRGWCLNEFERNNCEVNSNLVNCPNYIENVASENEGRIDEAISFDQENPLFCISLSIHYDSSHSSLQFFETDRLTEDYLRHLRTQVTSSGSFSEDLGK